MLISDRYLLHVGFPKTASTWLQHYLQESQRINYIGKHAGGKRWKSEEIKSIRTSLQGLREPYSFTEVHKIISDTIEVNPELPLVLSDEVLAKPWKDKTNWTIEYAQLLNMYFPGGKILLTVRKQSDIACSLYRKHVEEHGLASMTMRDWFNQGAGSQDIDFWHRWDLLAYYQGLAKFFDGNITVIPYEMMKSAKAEYCSLITGFFEIDDVDLKIEKPVNQMSFQTNYWQVIKMLLKPRYWHQIKQELKVKPRYDLDLIQTIDEHFSDNNKELARLANINLAVYSYYKSI